MRMETWETFSQRWRQVTREARQPIGRPVVLRGHEIVADPAADLVSRAADWSGIAQTIFGGPILRVNSRLAADRAFVGMVEFPGGQLLSVTVQRGACNLVDGLLIGDQGLLHHEGAAQLSAEFDYFRPNREVNDPHHRRLRMAIETPILRSITPWQPAGTFTIGPPPWGVLLVTGGRSHQEMYGPMFAADPRCRVVALTDEVDVPTDRQRWNQELADQLNIPHIPDLAQALARPEIDIVCVCAEHERRARIGARAAAAGKHIYLDKSVGCVLADLHQLEHEIDRTGVASQMFTLNGAPIAERARTAIASGRLGRIRAAHGDLLFAKGFTGTVAGLGPRHERWPAVGFTHVDAKRELETTGIYTVALLLWLLDRRVQSVTATTANYFFAEHRARDVEDFGAATLELEDGVIASLTAGRIGHHAHPGLGPNRLVIVGENDSILLDADRPRLDWRSDIVRPVPRRNPDDPMAFWTSTAQGWATKPTEFGLPSATGRRNDVQIFLDALQAGAPLPMDIRRAKHATEVILACYQSAAQQRTITLPIKDA